MLTLNESGDVTEIHLVDDLHHPAFSWPRSLLHVELAEQVPTSDRLAVLDGEGRAVGQIHAQALGRDLYFLAEMATGGRQSWRLTPADDRALLPQPAAARVDRRDTSVLLDNGVVQVELSTAPQALAYRVLTDAHGEQLRAEIAGPAVAERSVEILGSGPVFAQVRQHTTLTDGSRLTLEIRLVSGEDTLQVRERMEGFTDGASRVVITARTGLTHRVAPNRPMTDADSLRSAMRHDGVHRESVHGSVSEGWETLDAHLRPDGEIPFHLRPYHTWNTWWRLPWAAFWTKDGSDPALGVYVDDVARWRDGEYAVWGSSAGLAVRFYLRGGRLTWVLPLANGERQLGLAVLRHADGSADTGETIARTMADRLRWRSWIPLDKVGRWVLGHREPRSAYPRVFRAEDHAFPGDAHERLDALTELLDGGQQTLVGTAVGGPRSAPGPAPVESRTIATVLAPLFDQLAPELDEETFDLASASLQFLAYLCRDEMLMPTRTMLAGHPNFLSDVLSQVMLLPLLFPRHPAAGDMAEHVAHVIALNVRLHTRPAVEAWGTHAGRWTENLGTYAFTHLDNVVMQSAHLRRHVDGRNRLTAPELRQLARWLIDTLSVPLRRFEGLRAYPPAGAHSYAGPVPRSFRVLAEELEKIDPLLSEQLYWTAPPLDFEWAPRNEGVFDHAGLLRRGTLDRRGLPPELTSRAYTGYGVVMRSRPHTPAEAVVILQQIDDGPNYRWGRAARGGNGTLYYAAAGERWTHMGAEHVGDGYYGDVEACTNFGVKAPGGYRDIGDHRAIGRGDLDSALVDLDTARFAILRAAPDIEPRYRSRSVLMVDSDYIVIHDDVPDPATEGRFSWFTDIDMEFPHIAQLLPGASFIEVEPERRPGEQRGRYPYVRGRYYDGAGEFLTLVSHRGDVTATPATWGAVVTSPESIDHVVRRPDRTTHEWAGISVDAEAAVIREFSDRTEAALLQGHRLTTDALEVRIDGNAGIDLVTASRGDHHGVIAVAGPQASIEIVHETGHGRFFLDGVAASHDHDYEGRHRIVLTLPRGRYLWQITGADPTPPTPRVSRVIRGATGVQVLVEEVAAADSYVVLDHDGDAVLASATSTRIELGADQRPRAVRVQARRGTALSAPSAPYPAPALDGPPLTPDGVVLTQVGNVSTLSWGTALGADHYRVLTRKRASSPWSLIATTVETAIEVALDADLEFAVTAVDGRGESDVSVPVAAASLDSEVARALSRARFTRATESHECGYPEYDPWVEERQPVLTYPASPNRGRQGTNTD